MLKSYRGEIHKAGLRCAHKEKIEDRKKRRKQEVDVRKEKNDEQRRREEKRA